MASLVVPSARVRDEGKSSPGGGRDATTLFVGNMIFWMCAIDNNKPEGRDRYRTLVGEPPTIGGAVTSRKPSMDRQPLYLDRQELSFVSLEVKSIIRMLDDDR